MGSTLDFYDTFLPLRVSNSLTRTVTPFVPMLGKRVLWYMCGPTVYDSAHLGHARTYLSFDILRRILTKYFGYDVLLVMNITDVDDKIIIRANERGIGFRELAAQYEAEFLRDMGRLGIAPPDVMTRVTEYIPEVIEFVERIIANGYAYASNGSVYFDVEKYGSSKTHYYGKLVPENVGNDTATAEGEGALSAGADDKRSKCDFALWKKSKPGEPQWESPWGLGRPGWHIECSAMAGDTLKAFAGGRIDIHSGGVDLRFPHHDNEIAQSEACFGCKQWTNYFIHSGHLHIDGLKMSKSLKNFISITAVLERSTARQLRLLFLNQKYNKPMTYSEDSLQEAAAIDHTFNEFFLSAKAKLRGLTTDGPQRWNDVEKGLSGQLLKARADVRVALCDDFNTPDALKVLRDLVNTLNKYMRDVASPPVFLLRACVDFISEILEVFGLINPLPSFGFSSGEGEGGASREETLAPVLDAVTSFRDTVRAAAKAGDTGAVLAACDKLRDATLPKAGVRIEDGSAPGESAVWKLMSAEDVVAAERAAAAAEAAREAKEKARAEVKAREAEAARKALIPPSELFKSDPAYSLFDEKGLPTHDKDGKEVSKGQIKKLQKLLEKQEKVYAAAIAAAAAAGGGGASGAGAGAGSV